MHSLYYLLPLAALAWASVFFFIGKYFGQEIEKRKILKQHNGIRILKVDRKVNKYQLANLPVVYKTENDYIKHVQLNCMNSVLEGLKPEHFHQSIYNHMDGDITLSTSLKLVLPCKKEI